MCAKMSHRQAHTTTENAPIATRDIVLQLAHLMRLGADAADDFLGHTPTVIRPRKVHHCMLKNTRD